MNNEMGYFMAVGEEADRAWRQYRQEDRAYRAAMAALANELGGPRVREAFGGGIIGVDELPPLGNPYRPAFKSSHERHGYFYLRTAPKVQKDREALAAFKEANDAVRALWPDPNAIASAHGFTRHLSYSDGPVNRGARVLGGILGVQALWYEAEGPIVLYAPDVAKAIANTRAQQESVVTDPASWTVPEGYRQITEVEYKYLAAKAAYELEVKERLGLSHG